MVVKTLPLPPRHLRVRPRRARLAHHRRAHASPRSTTPATSSAPSTRSRRWSPRSAPRGHHVRRRRAVRAARPHRRAGPRLRLPGRRPPYKFYGPHQGVLYGRREMLDRLHAYKLRVVPDERPTSSRPGASRSRGRPACWARSSTCSGWVPPWAPSTCRPRPTCRDAPPRSTPAMLAMARVRALAQRPADRRPAGHPRRARARHHRPGRVRPAGAHRVVHADPGIDPADVARFLDEHGVYVWNGHSYALPVIEWLGLADVRRRGAHRPHALQHARRGRHRGRVSVAPVPGDPLHGRPPTIVDHPLGPWRITHVEMRIELRTRPTRSVLVESQLHVEPVVDGAQPVRWCSTAAACRLREVVGRRSGARTVRVRASTTARSPSTCRPGPHVVRTRGDGRPPAGPTTWASPVGPGLISTTLEPQGFRRITCFLDRPANRPTFDVTLVGDPSEYPVMLCNGHLVRAPASLRRRPALGALRRPHHQVVVPVRRWSPADLAMRSRPYIDRAPAATDHVIGIAAPPEQIDGADFGLDMMDECSASTRPTAASSPTSTTLTFVAIPGYPDATEYHGLMFFDSSVLVVDTPRLRRRRPDAHHRQHRPRVGPPRARQPRHRAQLGPARAEGGPHRPHGPERLPPRTCSAASAACSTCSTCAACSSPRSSPSARRWCAAR